MTQFTDRIRKLLSKHWVKGALVGEAVWLASVAAFWLLTVSIEQYGIRSAIVVALHTISAIVFLPVYYGGFLFLWGDAPPNNWVNNLSFNIVFSLVFYACLGAAVGILVSMTTHHKRRKQ